MLSNNELLFELPFYKGTFSQAIKLLIVELNQPASAPKIVVTPNLDHLVRINKDFQLFQVYKTADYFFADGFPLVLASKLLSKPLSERITGADMFPALCQFASQKKLKVFILGGHPDDKDIHKKLTQLYPDAEFLVYSPKMDFQFDGSEGSAVVDMINKWKPSIVFCCLGMPKQELWALHNRSKLNTKLILCVGAALDFAIGKTRRAPILLQKTGFEWLWRLCNDPTRLWQRYFLGFFYFINLLIKELIKK